MAARQMAASQRCRVQGHGMLLADAAGRNQRLLLPPAMLLLLLCCRAINGSFWCMLPAAINPYSGAFHADVDDLFPQQQHLQNCTKAGPISSHLRAPRSGAW